MALSTCADCSTAYAVGLAACPHCGSTDRKGSGSVLPYLDVVCGNDFCRAFTQVRRIYLRQVVPGVVEMPGVLVCVPCGMAMGALRSWEDDMPKITRHGGPTNAADQPSAAETTPEPAAAPVAPAREEESSPGSSSETSSPRPEKSSEPSGPDPQKPAPTTGSRSKRARGASSTARSTGGSGSAE